MLKYFILVISVTIVLAATDLNKFTGEWYHVGMYTAASELSTCTKFNITLDGSPCTCDGRAASALKFGMVSLPIVVIEDYSEVGDALAHKCTSGDIMKTMAVRLVNDDFFVLYETCYHCTEKEPNTANLMARRIPTKSELDNLNGIDELKGRNGMQCDLVK